MTSHDLAVQAVDSALKAARDLVRQLEGAARAARARNYLVARTGISDAVTTASYLDHHYLPNAGHGLETCK